MGRSTLLSLIVLASVPSWPAWSAPGGGPIALGDCFGADTERAAQCRLEVAGIHHALTVVQSRHGLTLPSCQFPPDLPPEALFERLRPELESNLAVASELSIGSLVAAALLDWRGCERGVARQPQGLRTIVLLRQCDPRQRDDTALARCTAYLRGLYMGLSQFSGFEDARRFACPPRRGMVARDVLRMLIDEARRDASVQQSPAADVLANALGRKHPCSSPE